ncbi:response regulator [Paenibacillus sp. sgz5001063]|uniref:response regulator n=1 Tax=Paenibacillus sp. sgz5001063 TaxID=3242474 RepID=UPI0036D4269C
MAKILITDDAAFMRLMVRSALEGKGHEIVGEAVNGAEAVKIYQQVKPDVVTMDITMPDMDGVTAVKNILAIDPGAKIIMCSAMGQTVMVMDAMKAGAKDFVVKPFQADRLLQAVENQL